MPSWAGHVVAGAVLAAACALHVNSLLNLDVAWLMTAAQRMLAGGSYTRDFFEVNMPLAIAAYIPPYLASRGLQLSFQAAAVLYVGLLSLQSAYLTVYCLNAGAGPTSPPAYGSWLGAWLLLGLLLVPGYDFGQKEHLVVILGLPWVCSIANYDGLAVLGRPLRLYLSLLAALGFYLKPHYAALPFALLAATAWSRKSWKPLLSLEMGVFLFVAAANACVVLLLYPDWFICARWASDLYGAYRARDLHKLFSPHGLWIYAASFVSQLAALALSRNMRPLSMPLLLCVPYAWAAYLLQYKGWSYQFLPVELFTFAGAALGLIGSARAPRANSSRSALALLFSAGAMLALTGTALAQAYRLPTILSLGGLPRVLAQANQGDYVFAFSIEVEPFLPAVPVMGLNWASRYSHLWPLLRIAQLENGGDPQERARIENAYRRPLVDSVIEDFMRYRPQLVLVDRRAFASLPKDYDILKTFIADERFLELWRNYVPIGMEEFPAGNPRFQVYWSTAP